MGKHIALIGLLMLSLQSLAVTVDCGTSGSVTSCVSPDLASGNIINSNVTGVTPKASLVINSTTDAVVDIATSVNSKPMKTNLFISNGGVASNLNADLSSKWNPNVGANGLTSAGDASSTLIVADILGDVAIDLSGYAGKSGKSSAELCAQKILAGDYGQSQIDLFKARCNDGTTANPCATAKLRTACDQQDVTNLNTASNAGSGFCPSGMSYLNAVDDSSNPAVSVTKNTPKPLRRCERPSYTAQVRTCKYKTYTCRYNFTTTMDTVTAFRFRNPEGYPDVATFNKGVVSMGTTGSPYQPSPCLAFSSNTQCLAVWHDGDFNRQLGIFDITFRNRYDEVAPTVNDCPAASFSFAVDSVANIVDDSGRNGSTKGSYHYINLVISLQGTQMLQSRVIDGASSCIAEPYEQDAGTSPSGVVAGDVKFLDSADACPGPASAGTPGYGDYGLVTNHNLTAPYVDYYGKMVDPVTSTTVSDCTRTSCQGIATGYSTSSVAAQSISLGAGERGSYGGTATIFAYDIVGNQSLTYANGVNGNNGLDNLVVSPVIKNCSAISGSGTSTPFAMFHQTFWKLFTFTPSSVSYNNSFPARAQSDAVSIFKKVSPGVADIIKNATCAECP